MEITIELADGAKAFRNVQEQNLIDEPLQNVSGTAWRDGNSDNNAIRSPPANRRDRGFHACPCGDPVIDQDRRAATRWNWILSRQIERTPPFYFLQLSGGQGHDLGLLQSCAAANVRIENYVWPLAIHHGSGSEFRLGRHTNLADKQKI